MDHHSSVIDFEQELSIALNETITIPSYFKSEGALNFIGNKT